MCDDIIKEISTTDANHPSLESMNMSEQPINNVNDIRS